MANIARNKQGLNLTLHNFQIYPKSHFLYLMDNDKARLVVPFRFLPRVFRIAHDNRAHVGINRIHHFLKNIIFAMNLRKRVEEYYKTCDTCAKTQLFRRPPFGDLQPLDSPVIPLTVLCLDFVVGLPMSINGNNCIFVIICKTFKFILIIVGKLNFTTEDWARFYLDRVYLIWGLPDVFVFDMDPKFVSELWKSLCEAANI